MAPSRQNALSILYTVSAAAVIAMFFVQPIAQDPSYHDFADKGFLLGMPNALNVLSNVFFCLVGWIGYSYCTHPSTHRHISFKTKVERHCWTLFFVGAFLVGPGSAYYHWNPNNVSLAWDRLPMTLAFSPLFCAIIAERIAVRAGKNLLAPLMLAGAATVGWWVMTDDLRAYAIAQFLPVVLLALVLFLFPAQYDEKPGYTQALAWYAFAKVLEHFDHQVFELTGFVSGHTLKHLAATLSVWALWRMVRDRIIRD